MNETYIECISGTCKLGTQTRKDFKFVDNRVTYYNTVQKYSVELKPSDTKPKNIGDPIDFPCPNCKQMTLVKG